MTDTQWETLLKVIRGESVKPLPVGFIIDCPWLPGWNSISILDYFTNDQLWLESNLKAIKTFQEVMFLPGFWSEYGMCTEPSAFGARCLFPANEFPHAHPVIRSMEDIDNLPRPNPKTDGLLPFVLNRLKLARPRIEAEGHHIKFAVARGPLNIASFLMGSTEFLTAMMMDPDRTHKLMDRITEFLKAWIDLQIETFPSIDGIFLLDDIIGFIGEAQFLEFGLPYFKKLYDIPVSVKFLHNDAACEVSAPHLPDMGVNLFNMGFKPSLNDLKRVTQNKVAMMGNIPPRDVLAKESPEEVRKAARDFLAGLESPSGVLFSCGGGMPPGVGTENIRAFVESVQR